MWKLETDPHALLGTGRRCAIRHVCEPVEDRSWPNSYRYDEYDGCCARCTNCPRFSVTLRALDDTEFKGYIVQARDGEDTIGEFEVPNKDDGKTLDCPGGTLVRFAFFYLFPVILSNVFKLKNAVTHSSRDKKKSVTFRWTAPDDFSGSVTFT